MGQPAGWRFGGAEGAQHKREDLLGGFFRGAGVRSLLAGVARQIDGVRADEAACRWFPAPA